MSKDIREMINKVKNFKDFINEGINMEEFPKKIKITQNLFGFTATKYGKEIKSVKDESLESFKERAKKDLKGILEKKLFTITNTFGETRTITDNFLKYFDARSGKYGYIEKMNNNEYRICIPIRNEDKYDITTISGKYCLSDKHVNNLEIIQD
jgi:hypothetical protein